MEHEILANRTTSVGELRRSPRRVIGDAAKGPVAILIHNEPIAYLIDAKVYEWMIERLEDLEDIQKALERQGEPGDSGQNRRSSVSSGRRGLAVRAGRIPQDEERRSEESL